MILLSTVISVHQKLIETHGGTIGIRDEAGLISALSRPFQQFDFKDLYDDDLKKAASLVESIISNHPFLDGNKRTAYVILRLFLINKGYDINATEDEKYQFIIDIASGIIHFEEIYFWLATHVESI
jgi:death-on-curing protein